MPALHVLLSGDTQDSSGLQNSHLASARLRLWPAARVATQLGYSVTVGEQCHSAVSALLVGKIGGNDIQIRAPRWLEAIERQRRQGATIVMDYTDHHLTSKSVMSPFYAAACQMADLICVPTSDLKAALDDQTRLTARVAVVPDPLEYELVRPKTRLRGEKPKLMWFGHPSNALFLAQFLDRYAAPLSHHSLTLVSAPQSIEVLRKFRFASPPKLSFSFCHWSVPAVSATAREADYCVIPSDPASPKRYASNNRLVTALALGLPTIATTLPSYVEVGDYFANDNSGSALKLMENPLAFSQQVHAFQDTEIHRFSRESVESSWRAILTKC